MRWNLRPRQLGRARVPPRTRNARTLTAVFTKPTLGGIVFTDIESLVVALGGSINEGAGSRIAFELNGTRRYLHRPHPGKEAKRYQVENLRDWFIELGIKP
ncbi:type II toxin-antitoxin system HicA family toxin [Mycetohabitans endofungorum]|uniref:type II toxin-antitoxin system HicA family toxin n=1 Tax=Mycetohabitans endofungorum TaxID=417203 RepID=UPI002B056DCB|nr:type II toxin-antitoxin system HicA family toxin [Mycetohabitans endofungorum]